MYSAITKCPVCSGSIKIKKLQCEKCNTIIENDFTFSKFERLSEEQLKFVETFLQYRGNIKDVEKALGISYPTVRGKLEDVNEALGLVEKKQNAKVKEKESIITRLECGEITSEEAIELLNKIK
ncbi:MAG: DUF2089 domain-containing protein [Clostridium sp.]|uniref:DUF2089 domain-containing protein n=1 Tax=Clostridium sp. TaxID=1506 RepID=UPI003038EAA4